MEHEQVQWLKQAKMCTAVESLLLAAKQLQSGRTLTAVEQGLDPSVQAPVSRHHVPLQGPGVPALACKILRYIRSIRHQSRQVGMNEHSRCGVSVPLPSCGLQILHDI